MSPQKKSSNLPQGLALLFLVVNIFLWMAIQTPSHHLDPAQVLEVLEEETLAAPSEAIPSSPQMILDWKLVDRYTEGEWSVEKYQEFELYVDEKGQVQKELPTAHYNYLKYWRYE